MNTSLRHSSRAFAVFAAALFAAGASLAERGDKAEKHAEKADKHAEKSAEKAGKRADKRAEGGERQAYSEPRHGRGHDEVRIGGYFDDRHRHAARRYYSEQYHTTRDCPPGLAKKNNGCMPPGQAKKYRPGEPLPAGVVVYEVPRPVLVQLPPPPYGYRYARVGNDIVLVQAQNNLVIDIIYGIFG
jgi:Ni/Co efflux regulator RcnB